ncbi:hypothetical protein ACPXB3_17285 [Gordonia sp. DT219]|uniref:hypothetical protein n=1 Tax=Gordonia sp. DT219 TaxID=3416658 RepID=UPI003CEDABCC
MELGVNRRLELLATGLTDNDLRRMVRRNELIAVRPGWYATRDADPQAVVAARNHGALSGPTALDKHGFWVPPGYDSVHIRSGKAALDLGKACCRPSGPPIPVHTILDQAPLALCAAIPCMTGDDWIAVADSFMHSAQLDVELLRAMLPRPTRVIDTLLTECDPCSQSGTETLVRIRLRRLGFEVVVQPRLIGVGFSDLLVGRLLIECDSELHHTSLENYRNDRRALAMGYSTMRLTYDDVLYGWDDTVADIEKTLADDRHRIAPAWDD